MEKTDNWTAFGSEYLKAIEVVSKDDEYVIVGVESKAEEGKGNVLHLNLERGELKKLFGCNKTNLHAIQEECPEGPKQAIGRIITFNKVQVTNPTTKQIVDGLRLQFVQVAESEKLTNANNKALEDLKDEKAALM